MNNTLWTHNKTGNEYRVLREVTNSNNCCNGELMVLYQRSDEIELSDPLYVREKQEFISKFTLVEEDE